MYLNEYAMYLKEYAMYLNEYTMNLKNYAVYLKEYAMYIKEYAMYFKEYAMYLKEYAMYLTLHYIMRLSNLVNSGSYSLYFLLIYSTFSPFTVPSVPCVAFPKCIAANCSWSFVCCFIILCVFFVTSCVLFYCVCIAVLHTVVAGLLARSQYPEGPGTGHLDTGFSLFPCAYKQMLR